jgi:hypothetical protein
MSNYKHCTEEEKKKKGNEASRKWKRNHPEKAQEATRKWKLNNRDHIREYARNLYHKNVIISREKARALDYDGRNGFILTIKDYNALLDYQKGVCAICGSIPTTIKLSVDHNHSTGKVRGLLCWHCNTSLGHLKESPEFFRNAADYLERNLDENYNILKM